MSVPQYRVIVDGAVWTERTYSQKDAKILTDSLKKVKPTSAVSTEPVAEGEVG